MCLHGFTALLGVILKKKKQIHEVHQSIEDGNSGKKKKKNNGTLLLKQCNHKNMQVKNWADYNYFLPSYQKPFYLFSVIISETETTVGLDW